MTLPVLTAMTDAAWEADFLAALERDDHGVVVVRRCVDLPDLLAVAAGGTARAALLSGDLRRLDRDAVIRLVAARVAVVAVVAADDETVERRLRQFGLRHVVATDAAPGLVVSALLDAVADSNDVDDSAALRSSYAVPQSALPEPPSARGNGAATVEPGTGRLVAVWGPTGAPGRTAVAVTLASELAHLGVPTLLADADSYGGVVAQVLGITDESPGLAGAARLANSGSLDLPALAELARAVGSRLRVLTGIARADRWPELRPHALDVVWSLARSLAAVTVVDCGFGIEQDEEIVYDTTAPRRNGATLATLAAADHVVAVATADPVGLQRFVRAFGDLRDTLPGVEPVVVVNRVRRGVAGAHPQRDIAAALKRYAGITDPVFIPLDVAGFDAALEAGLTLTEAAPGSPARPPVRELAARFGGVTAALPRRRRRLVQR